MTEEYPYRWAKTRCHELPSEKRFMGLQRCTGQGGKREHLCGIIMARDKVGRWQVSHNSVLSCCGFILFFCAAMTILTLVFEPSTSGGVGKQQQLSLSDSRADSQELGGPLRKERSTNRIRRALTGGTRLQLQQDVAKVRTRGIESKLVRREESGDDLALPNANSGEGNPLRLATDLRIYVYDLPSQFNTDWLNDTRCSNHLFAAEVALHQILLESPIRTLDPDDADFYFVPLYVACNFSPPNGFPSLTEATKIVSSAVELISREMGYWNRRRGRDHIFVASHDYGACFHAVEELAVAAGVPKFLQDAVIVQTFGHSGGQHPCHPANVILIPPYVSPESVKGHWQPVETQDRDIFAHFRGKLELHPKAVNGRIYSKGVRTRLWQKFRKDDHFFLERKRHDGYPSEMLRSKFCLAPLGWAPWSPRLVEAVVYGCVPVIIADNIALPYSHVINWSSISLTVRENEVETLGQILRHVASTNLTVIQKNLWVEENRRALLFSRPLRLGDASWHVFDLLARKKASMETQRAPQQDAVNLGIAAKGRGEQESLSLASV